MASTANREANITAWDVIDICDRLFCGDSIQNEYRTVIVFATIAKIKLSEGDEDWPIYALSAAADELPSVKSHFMLFLSQTLMYLCRLRTFAL